MSLATTIYNDDTHEEIPFHYSATIVDLVRINQQTFPPNHLTTNIARKLSEYDHNCDACNQFFSASSNPASEIWLLWSKSLCHNSQIANKGDSGSLGVAHP